MIASAVCESPKRTLRVVPPPKEDLLSTATMHVRVKQVHPAPGGRHVNTTSRPCPTGGGGHLVTQRSRRAGGRGLVS